MAENPYELFMANVRSSVEAVLAVARSEVLNGYDVHIKGMQFADNYEKWQEAADEGYDLIINGKTINVKRNSRDFSSIEEFIEPFKNFDRPILVSAAHVETPDVTLILNSRIDGGIAISKEYKEHWGTRRNVFDPRYKTKQDCFDVSPKYVSWLNLKR